MYKTTPSFWCLFVSIKRGSSTPHFLYFYAGFYAILTWQNRSFHLGNACGHQPHCCSHVYVVCQKPNSDICSHIFSETKARQINFMATIWMKTTGFSKFWLLVGSNESLCQVLLAGSKVHCGQNENHTESLLLFPSIPFPTQSVCRFDLDLSLMDLQ